jgi:6-phosphogluconolactonase
VALMARDVEVRIAPSPGQAVQLAASALAQTAQRGGHIAVSGGSTPRPAYVRAAELEPDWSAVALWFADERCVPPDDSRSNYRLVRETLLDGVAQPPVVHRIHGEFPPEEAAVVYDEIAAGLQLDLALLGIGPDGHTASLFPDSPTLAERERAAVSAEPKFEPFVRRVTLTLPVLCSAELVLFLVVGEEKAEAAARAFEGEPSPATPASLVRSRAGRTVAVLDRAAASRLAEGPS